MRIALVTADNHGPQGWWRAHVPAAILRAAGHEAYSCSGLAADDRHKLRPMGLRQTVRPPQAVVLQGWFHPDAPGMIARARRAGQVVLADLDDDVWNLPPSHPAYALAAEWRPQLEAVLGACDAVLASTPTLAAEATAHGARAVAVARNGVPSTLAGADHELDLLGLVDGAQADARRGRVAWLGRTTYRGDDLAMIGPALRLLARDGFLTTFVHYGAVPGDPAAAAVPDLDDCATETHGWQHPETLVGDLRSCDVVLIPQQDNGPARSNAAGLLCAAAGVPFIATPTPEYELLALDGCGLGAVSTHEWVNLAGRLLSDPFVRIEQAADQLRGLARGWLAEQTVSGWADTIATHHQCARREAEARAFTPRGVRGGG